MSLYINTYIIADIFCLLRVMIAVEYNHDNNLGTPWMRVAMNSLQTS